MVDFRAVIGFNSGTGGGFTIDDSGQVSCEVTAVRNDADVFVKDAELADLYTRQAATGNYNRTGREFLCLSNVFSAFG